MRRIVERTVTIVTTTTWKISWQEDTALSTEKADQAVHEFPKPQVSQVKVQNTEQLLPLNEAKEVDL
jgi:hypothetical protein